MILISIAAALARALASLGGSRRSLDGAELAKRNPGSPIHGYLLDHSNRQLAKVDNDARMGLVETMIKAPRVTKGDRFRSKERS